MEVILKYKLKSEQVKGIQIGAECIFWGGKVKGNKKQIK
jgi:hypothetical protein